MCHEQCVTNWLFRMCTWWVKRESLGRARSLVLLQVYNLKRVLHTLKIAPVYTEKSPVYLYLMGRVWVSGRVGVVGVALAPPRSWRCRVWGSACVCVCVCVYIYIYNNIYIHMCTYICNHIHICIYIYIYLYKCAYVYIYIYTYILCIHIHIHIHIYRYK